MTAPQPRIAGASATLLVAFAAVLLSIGTTPREPNIGAVAAIIALILVLGAVVLGDARGLGRFGQRAVIGVLLVGIGLELLVSLAIAPIRHPLFSVGLAASAIAGAMAIVDTKRRTPLLVLAVLIQSAVMIWMVAGTVPRSNDVYFFNQLGAEALLAGRNPYELEFPNIYGQGTPLYAPEVQEGDHVTFGFPYPPLSLFMALPGYAVGDYRYAAVVAVALTALLAYAGQAGRVSAAVAVLLLVSPLAQRLLHYGWTETFVGLTFSATAVSATRWPRALPWLLGLVVAVKQYMAPVIVLAAVLLRGSRGVGWRKLVVLPVLVAGLTVLPFLLWAPGDFLFSVVFLQGLQPFRIDAASIPGLVARLGGPQLPAWIGFAAGGAAGALALWRAPRTPAGFSIAAGFAFLAFFLLSKQAFMNYYYLVLVLLACGIALGAPRPASSVAVS